MDSFPSAEKAFASAQLAGCLTAVIAQRLVDDESDVTQQRAEFEVMVNTPAVASGIREGKMHLLAGIIQTSSADGMQCFPLSENSHHRGEAQHNRRTVQAATVHSVVWPGEC